MSHVVITPVLLPLCTAILLLLLNRSGTIPRALGMAAVLAQLGMAAVLAQLGMAAVLAQLGLALLLTALVSDGEILVYALGHWPAPFGIVLVADRLAAWMLVTTALLALFALWSALQGDDITGAHFHVLFQLQLFGINGAFLTGDLFNLFVFFEILLLASYGLLLHGGGRHRTRAGLHFVVVNLIGSTLFLFAVGTLYGVLGTLNMADLARKIADVPPENVWLVQSAGFLLFSVFALKAALLPFYLWLPAAYAKTSAPVAALFAIMTKVGAYSILRVSTLLFGAQAGPIAHLFDPLLPPLAMATLVIGALGAVASVQLRQQVAYLVVASVGSLLLAFGLGHAEGIAAGLYYLPHTTFTAAALFLLADVIARQRGASDDRLDPGPAIAGSGLLGALFFIAAVAMAGLPPLAGFVGKLLTLRAALDHPLMFWMMATVLSAGLLSMIALARSGSLLFFRPAAAETDAVVEQPLALARRTAPIIGLLLLGLGLMLGAGPLTSAARASADQLLQPQVYMQAVLAPGGLR